MRRGEEEKREEQEQEKGKEEEEGEEEEGEVEKESRKVMEDVYMYVKRTDYMVINIEGVADGCGLTS